MSLFIDIGAGIVPSIWFVLAVHRLFYNCKATVTVLVWCGVAISKMNGQIYKRLLTNRLHSKAAEPY